MLPLLACTQTNPDPDPAEDSAPLTRPTPWQLDDPGPLAPLFGAGTIVPRWEVRRATSADGGDTWIPDERVLAFALSSLSGLVHDDTLVLVANVDVAMASPLDVPDPQGALALLATPDLETWTSTLAPVADPASPWITDPSLWIDDAERIHGTWFAAESGDGDPAGQEGTHDIVDATWSGTAFAELPEPIYADAGLADPVIGRVGDHWTLAATRFASEIVLATSEDGVTFAPDPAHTWPGVSVPHVRAVGEDLHAVAQHTDGYDVPDTAVLAADGRIFVGQPLYDAHPWGTNCTSPVVLDWEGGLQLYCAVRVEENGAG